MARIRTLKPEQPKDEALAALPIHARYLFAFLPTHADREGRLEDRPRVLKIEIFPWDEDVDVDGLLNLLAPHFIVRYEADGKRFIQIRQFVKHQRPNVRELPSTIPEPTQNDLEHSGTIKNIQERAYKGTGREGNGREREGNGNGGSTPKARFQAPCIEEVKAYCQERNNHVDAQAWIDHYTSNGWRVGRNAMKDWKAAVRTWEKNDYGTKNGIGGGNRSGRVVGAAAPVAGKYDHIG